MHDAYQRYLATFLVGSVLCVMFWQMDDSNRSSSTGSNRLEGAERRIDASELMKNSEAIQISLRMMKSDFITGEPLYILEVATYRSAQPCYYPDHDDFNERLCDGKIHLAFDDKTIEPGAKKNPLFPFPMNDGFRVGFISGKPNKTTFRLTDLQKWYTPIPPGEYHVPYHYEYTYTVRTPSGQEFERKGVAKGILNFTISAQV